MLRRLSWVSILITFSISLSLSLSLSLSSFAGDGNYDYRSSSTLKPNDYLFGSKLQKEDEAFNYPVIGLNVDFGVSQSCGQLSIASTLKSSMKNLLNSKYLKSMGTQIVAASPLLVSCYFSPTWCAIAKHLRIKADFLANLRLQQCKAINKYVDEKADDFYKERSKCASDEMKRTGGDLEVAMDKCRNWNEAKISDWSGNGKTSENRMIESTVKWAGLKGKEADRMVRLTKAFVGDTIIKRGSVSIDFGPRRLQLTPRMHLMTTKTDTFKSLCSNLLGRVIQNGGYKANIHRLVSENDLNSLSGEMKYNLIDRQTLVSLAYLPKKKRQIACRKLADSLAMEVFSNDMNKTMDFMAAKVESNPHLPEKQKRDAARKRLAFKDQVEMTVSTENRTTEPLNKVLAQINAEGSRYQALAITEDSRVDKASKKTDRLDHLLLDCADGIACHNPDNF